MCLDVLWCGVFCSCCVEFVLFSDLSSDLWGAPGFSAWFWYSFMCFYNTLYGLLYVVEVLCGCGVGWGLLLCSCYFCFDFFEDGVFVSCVALF